MVSSCLRGVVLRAMAVGLAFFISTGAMAQTKITPTEVYSVVQAANTQLEHLIEANLLTVPAPDNSQLTNRRPRHVFQKARAVFEILQTARSLNGLKRQALPAVPGRDLTPGDVMTLVTSILNDTNELAALYGLPAVSQQNLDDKKKPADVYMALLHSIKLIGSLDVPPPLPNDVYRVADTILVVTRELAAHRGVEGLPDTTGAVTGKKPGEVYKRGADLLTVLREVSGDGKLLQIPAGVVAPNLRTGKITPGHVNDLLGMVLADLIVAKVQLGIAKETPFRPAVGGKTPSDVFERLDTAHAVLTRLQ